MSIRKILGRFASFANDFLNEAGQSSKLETDYYVLEQNHKDLARRFWEQFAVIEKVLKERDQWRDLYRLHVEQHLNAQVMLTNNIVKYRKHTALLLSAVNKLLEEKKEPPIKGPSDLEPIDGQLTDLPEKYVQRMTAAHDLLKSSLDAIGERDRIAQGLQR